MTFAETDCTEANALFASAVRVPSAIDASTVPVAVALVTSTVVVFVATFPFATDWFTLPSIASEEVVPPAFATTSRSDVVDTVAVDR